MKKNIARKLSTFLIVIATICGTPAFSYEHDQPTSVSMIDSGPIRGIDNGKLFSYLGIPYAKPPVGEFRWQPPQAPEPWTETYNATKISNQCVQNSDLGAFATPGGQEDCLYLNVYTPRTAKMTQDLPVFVWIHGGSLWVGQGADYDPSKIVEQQNAIVVTFNYRLGMFGFFAHPDIKKENKPYANYGQMDQSFALDWVQRNISSFGGDPKNVTIAGESSGGTSVLAQVISPWNKGKFQNAVIMSGSSMVLKYPNFGAPRPLDVAEKVATDFATAVGCKKQNAECLRNLTIGQILATQTPYMINQTIIDGDFMPISPAQAIQEGQINDVTVMVGTNRDEGRFFAGFTENETKKPLTEKSYYETLDAFFGIELATIIKQQYPISEYNSASEAYSAVMTDYLFSCPANRLMHSLSEHTKVYAYEFSDRTAPSYLKPTTFPQGAYHTAELAYLFPGFHGGKVGQPIVLNYLQEVLSNEIIQYWVTLTQSNKWKNWKPYNSKKENVYRLMLPKSHSLTKGRYISDHQCSFWDTTNVY